MKLLKPKSKFWGSPRVLDISSRAWLATDRIPSVRIYMNGYHKSDSQDIRNKIIQASLPKTQLAE